MEKNKILSFTLVTQSAKKLKIKKVGGSVCVCAPDVWLQGRSGVTIFLMFYNGILFLQQRNNLLPVFMLFVTLDVKLYPKRVVFDIIITKIQRYTKLKCLSGLCGTFTSCDPETPSRPGRAAQTHAGLLEKN